MSQKPKQVAFQRLHALVKRGYRPRLGDLNVTSRDEIELYHTRKYAKPPVPDVVLSQNGNLFIESIGDVEADESEEFDRFIQNVKLPTFYDLHIREAVSRLHVATEAAIGSGVLLIALHFAWNALFPAGNQDIWPLIWMPAVLWSVLMLTIRSRD